MLNKILKSCQSVEVNKVTSLSKVLASLIFIILPFFAGYIGYEYGYEMGQNKTQLINSILENDGEVEPIIMAPIDSYLPEQPKITKPVTPSAQTEVELKALIESLLKTEATIVSECRTLPMGSAPCGGPAYYLPYSISTTKELPQVLSLANEYNALAMQANQDSGIAGICVITPIPELKLVNNKCSF